MASKKKAPTEPAIRKELREINKVLNGGKPRTEAQKKMNASLRRKAVRLEKKLPAAVLKTHGVKKKGK